MMESFSIGTVPALLLGEPSRKVCLFLHGQGGNKEEAIPFAQTAVPGGWQVLGVDLTRSLPWEVLPELEQIFAYMAGRWERIALRANSIGAWYSLLAFARKPVEKCLFVSPVLDMERLILDMMSWSGVTEEQLEREKSIRTGFGQTLSWDYLTYVRQHPVTDWPIPTEILYADRDEMVARATVDQFAETFHSRVTVMEGGEHWFHTPEQLAFLRSWEETAFTF